MMDLPGFLDGLPNRAISDDAVEVADYTRLPATPMVSVSMMTYNHAPFIAQAIEGVLQQKTDFPFELVIGEDCSTDGTRQIVFDYQKKYPDIIRVITSDKNVGGRKNNHRTMNACRGKYVAFCEGDDYWHHRLKLQKQVVFMEANPEYSMCFHDGTVIYSDINKEPHLFGRLENREYHGNEFYSTWTVPTASILFRRNIVEYISCKLNNHSYYYGDIIILLSLCEKGKARCIDQRPMSVYRRHLRGLTQAKRDLAILKKLIEHHKQIAQDFNGKYADSANKILASLFAECALNEEATVFAAMEYLFRAFSKSKLIGIKAFAKLLINKLYHHKYHQA